MQVKIPKQYQSGYGGAGAERSAFSCTRPTSSPGLFPQKMEALGTRLALASAVNGEVVDRNLGLSAILMSPNGDLAATAGVIWLCACVW